MYRVMKFGGTSVGSIEKLKDIAKFLWEQNKDDKLIVVVSAMNKATDELTKMAEKITLIPNGRELDRLLSIGEQQTISLLALATQEIGLKTISLTAEQLKIKTTLEYNNARIKSIDREQILYFLEENDILIVAGFQGINDLDEVTTLGRGGSDTTAVALASSLDTICEIYTDVEGIYATDPRIYPNARKICNITFDEMSELATSGAEIMHNRSIFLAKKYDTTIYIAKSLSKERGTYIMRQIIENNAVSAITKDENVINYTVRSNDREILEKVTKNKINIDMVSQIEIEGEIITAFSTRRENINKVRDLFAKQNVEINDDLAKVSLVGIGMSDSIGVMSKIFTTLNKNNIELFQTSTSEITVSLLVKREDATRTVIELCKTFNLEEKCK